MQINDIKTLVARLGAIVDGWDEQSGAPAVERHIAASLLAELYEAVKFDTALAATEVTKVVVEPDVVEEPVELTPTEEMVSEVIDLSDIFGGSSDDDQMAEPAVEEVAEEVAEEPAVPEIEPEPEEPIAEEEVQEPIEEQPEVIVEEEPIEEQPAEEEEEQPTVAEPETPAIEEEIIETKEEQPAAEENNTAEIEEQPTATEAEQPAAEEKPKSEQASLFDMEIVRRPRSSSGRRVIMSLYGDSSAPAPREKRSREQIAEPTPETTAKPETPVAPQPSEQPTDEAPKAVSVAERIAAAQTEGSQVLGDVIGAGTTTLAEAVAASQPTVQTVQNDRVNSLRTSIGINDRFIMIRDLFGGDGAAFDSALDELDAFEDFNECLVYMSTYRWNPNSDGARLLMDLVTRKLL